jgi:hypothetical protein
MAPKPIVSQALSHADQSPKGIGVQNAVAISLERIPSS